MSTFASGANFLIRAIRHRPGFVVLVVLTLALVLGPTTAIFNVVNSVLLKPFPYPEPERLAILYTDNPKFGITSVSFPDYLDWEDQNQVFSSIAAYRDLALTYAAQGSAERVRGRVVTAGFFATLGIAPTRGREFERAEDQPGGRPAAVLSHGFWQRRLGGEESVLGQSLDLDGRPYEVVGILPQSFRFLDPVDVYVPLRLQLPPNELEERGEHVGIYAVGRLADGIDWELARLGMESVSDNINTANPDTSLGDRAIVEPLDQYVLGRIRPALLLLLGAMGFVLLIASANLANLFINRALQRRKEMALRAAVGAGRNKLIAQQIVESVQLFLVGGAVALLLVYWFQDGLKHLLPPDLPRLEGLGLDWRVTVFALLLPALIGVGVAFLPALQSLKSSWAQTLKEGGRDGGDGDSGRGRGILVVAQIALTLLLLVGASLVLLSFWRLSKIDPGFDSRDVLSLQVSLPAARYSEAETILSFYRRVLEDATALPAVNSAAIVSDLPFHQSNENSFWLDDRAIPEDFFAALVYTVSGDYFATLDLPLRSGRTFNSFDRPDSTRVTVIDEVMAERFWPAGDPLGTNLCVDDGSDEGLCWEIVGVVGHAKQFGLDEQAEPQFYFPYTQLPEMFVPFILPNMTLVAETVGAPLAARESIQQVVWNVDPNQPVYNIQPLERLIASSIGQQRFALLLLGLAAVLALFLSLLGIYAVMATAVTSRRREIGIRMALGARPDGVQKMFIRQSLIYTAIGLVAGLVGVFAFKRHLEHLLYESSGDQFVVIASACLLLLIVSMIGCYLPARRATRINPLTALRSE